MTFTVTLHDRCRLCQGVLDPVLDLGHLALPTFPRPEDDPAPRVPLDLTTCRTCGLVQLRHTVSPDALFRTYWYRSSTNEAMQAELTDIVRAALAAVDVEANDPVIDIGANDGFLLSQYPLCLPHRRPERIAFEPAHNLKDACRRHAEQHWAEYFPPTGETRATHVLPVAWRRKVKVLTSIACFYDVEDPTAFVQAVDVLLAEDGVWIVQLQDLAQTVEATAFDCVCAEHLTYWSLASFEFLLARTDVDLHIVHAERRPINGGSLRLLIRRRHHTVDETVHTLAEQEAASITWQALERFAWSAVVARTQIEAAVHAATRAGLTVDLYGPSTKAETLTQWVGLGPPRIRQAWERHPDKIGRLTAMGIPIVDEETGRADPPDLLLVGIWQFREGILRREADYLAGGGRLLFPLPVVDVVSYGLVLPTVM